MQTETVLQRSEDVKKRLCSNVPGLFAWTVGNLHPEMCISRTINIVCALDKTLLDEVRSFSFGGACAASDSESDSPIYSSKTLPRE